MKAGSPWLLSMISLLLIAGEAAASSHASLRAPAGLGQIRIDQHLGAQLPLELEFLDAQGRSVRLADLFQGRPSVLVLGYFRCGNLCGVVRAGLAHAIANTGLRAGEDFNVLVASIDPDESAPEARAAQSADEAALAPGDLSHWRYLTGTAFATEALARTVGFGSLFDGRNGQFAHAAGIVLLTPQGRVAQYFLGVRFAPLSLRLGLVNASRGGIGTLADRLLLLCCDYDATTGRYSVLIDRVLQILGLLTLLALGLLIGVLTHVGSRRTSECS